MPRFMGPYTMAYAAKLRKQGYRKVLRRGRSRAAMQPAYNRGARRADTGLRRALVRQGLAPELKFFDTNIGILFDNTAEVSAPSLNLIPQGDTSTTRDGRLATIKSIQFRGIITGGAAVPAPDTCYMWIILDTQNNGAGCSVTDVFTSTVTPSMLINLNNNKRFRILHKEVIAPQKEGFAPLAAAGGDWSWPVEFFVKCDIPINWNSTTGTMSEITMNNILMITGSSPGDDVHALSGNFRVRFLG